MMNLFPENNGESNTNHRNAAGGDHILRMAHLLRRIDESTELANLDSFTKDAQLIGDTDLSGLEWEQRRQLQDAKRCLDILRQMGDARPDSTVQNSKTIDDSDQQLPNSTHSISVGDTVGRFEIKRLIGEGGFSRVYLAHDPALKRDVALKIPRSERLNSDDARIRFSREAEAAAMLSHPNIVPVYESGNDGHFDYISFGYCSGQTLAEYSKNNQIKHRDTAHLVAVLANALSHAHDRGIIHRDLKPSNILVHETVGHDLAHRMRIADFGLARNLFVQDQNLTTTGAIVGTPAYMSPEQVRVDLEIGPATDIYSLGVILYELLTGQQPHTKNHFVSTLRAIEEYAPIAPRQINQAVPKELEAICLKCLNKQPSDRYTSAFELAEDLQNYLANRPIRARKSSLSIVFKRWCQRNPWIAASLLFGILSLSVGASIATVKWLDAEQEKQKAVAANEIAQNESQRAANLLATFADSYRQIDREKGRSDLSANQILSLTYDQVKKKLQGDPAAQAEMYDMLADCFNGLGDPEKALQCRIDENKIAETSTDFDRVLDSRYALMAAYRSASQTAKSLAIQRETIGRCNLRLGENHPETIKQNAVLGICLLRVGKPLDGIELERQLLEKLDGNNYETSLKAYVTNRLANLLVFSGRESEALDLYQQRMPDFQSPLTHRNELDLLADAKRNYSEVLALTGRKAKAIDLQRDVVELREKLKNSKAVIAAKRRLASVHKSARQYELAAEIMRDTVELTIHEFGKDHPRSIAAMADLTIYERDVQGFDTAISMQLEAVERNSHVAGPNDLLTIDVLFALAKSYRLNGDYGLAVNTIEEAARRMDLNGTQSFKWKETKTRESARTYAAAGMMDDALNQYQQLIEQRQKIHGPQGKFDLLAVNELCLQFIRMQSYSEAEKLARIYLKRPNSPSQSVPLAYTSFCLSYALERQGRWKEATDAARKALESDRISNAIKAVLNSILGNGLAHSSDQKAAESMLLDSFTQIEQRWLDMQPHNYRSSLIRPQTRFIVLHAAERIVEFYLRQDDRERVEFWENKISEIDQLVPPISNSESNN